MEMHERLEMLRERRGISARELARQVGVKSDSTVWRWLNGEQEPRLSEAARLADYFGIRLDEQAGRETSDSDLTEGERQLLRLVRRLGVDEAERRLLLLDDVPAQKHERQSLPLPPRPITGELIEVDEPSQPPLGAITGELHDVPVKKKGRKKSG